MRGGRGVANNFLPSYTCNREQKQEACFKCDGKTCGNNRAFNWAEFIGDGVVEVWTVDNTEQDDTADEEHAADKADTAEGVTVLNNIKHTKKCQVEISNELFTIWTNVFLRGFLGLNPGRALVLF